MGEIDIVVGIRDVGEHTFTERLGVNLRSYICDFMLKLYQTTQQEQYLQLATQAGDQLIEESLVDETEAHWEISPTFERTYTGAAHGSAAVGKILLDLYEQSGKAVYLEVAQKTYRWLLNHQLPLGNDGIGWKRLTQDDYVYNGWCGGAIGMLPFFFKLYELTLDTGVMDIARKIGNGLVNIAKKEASGVSWAQTHSDPTSTYTIYCHGVAGIIDKLFDLADRFPDSPFEQMALEGLEWLKSLALPFSEGGIYWQMVPGWDRVETGYVNGVASVARVFSRAYLRTQDPSYLNMVEQTSELLLRIAHRREGADQLKWNSAVFLNSDAYEPGFYTGWFMGAAGIGLYWLDVYRMHTID